MLKITQAGGMLRFEVRAKPRASKSAVLGERDGALEVRLAAPPVDGAANEELVSLLSHVLDVARSSVAVVRGERSRVKLVEVRGIDEGALVAMLGRGTTPS